MQATLRQVLLKSATNQISVRVSTDSIDFRKMFDEQICKNDVSGLIREAYKYAVKLALKGVKETEEEFGVSKKCANGCNRCCVFPIQVYPLEIRVLTDYINTNFESTQKKELKKKIKETQRIIKNNVTAKKHTEKYREQYIESRIMCPFLDADNNSCIVYDVRPMSCLNYFEYESSQNCKDKLITNTTINYDDAKFTIVFIVNKILHSYELYNGLPEGTLSNRYLDPLKLEILASYFNLNDIR